MSLNEKKIQKTIKGKRNVRGYVKTLQKRIRDGVEVDEEVIVILVDEKVPKDTLGAADLIPEEIDGVPTDVIVSEKVVAAGTKDKVSPLVAGYSIGHINISAGSLGGFFERIRDGHAPILGSNRHVFSDTLGGLTLDKRILQPGPSDSGIVPAAARYLEGTNLKMPLNPFKALWMVLVNLVYQLLGQTPPYDLTDSTPRNLDFAVAEPIEPVSMLHAGLSDWDDYCGIFFATSPSKSFFCKAKYITAFGYKMMNVNTKEAVAGDTVYKGDSRTTARGSATVLYDSVFLWVSYGGFGNDRPFDDVVMTTKVIDGGDSGTAAFLKATFT
jgi:hypothetical protein